MNDHDVEFNVLASFMHDVHLTIIRKKNILHANHHIIPPHNVQSITNSPQQNFGIRESQCDCTSSFHQNTCFTNQLDIISNYSQSHK